LCYAEIDNTVDITRSRLSASQSSPLSFSYSCNNPPSPIIANNNSDIQSSTYSSNNTNNKLINNELLRSNDSSPQERQERNLLDDFLQPLDFLNMEDASCFGNESEDLKYNHILSTNTTTNTKNFPPKDKKSPPSKKEGSPSSPLEHNKDPSDSFSTDLQTPPHFPKLVRLIFHFFIWYLYPK